MTYHSFLQCHNTKPELAKLRNPDTGTTYCPKDIFKAAIEGDVECLRANLDLGADINQQGQPGAIWGPRFNKAGLYYATPLHYACAYNRELAVRFLLHRGARTDIRSASGLTCKEYARRRNYVHLLVLLDRRASAAAQDEDAAGQSEQHDAEEAGESNAADETGDAVDQADGDDGGLAAEDPQDL